MKHPILVVAFPNQNAGPEARLLYFHDLNADQGRAHRRHLGVPVQGARILRTLMVLAKTIDTELDLWLPRSGIDQKNGQIRKDQTQHVETLCVIAAGWADTLCDDHIGLQG